jgi:hypothetical protein
MNLDPGPTRRTLNRRFSRLATGWATIIPSLTAIVGARSSRTVTGTSTRRRLLSTALLTSLFPLWTNLKRLAASAFRTVVERKSDGPPLVDDITDRPFLPAQFIFHPPGHAVLVAVEAGDFGTA